MSKRIGNASGLDYHENVTVDGGLLTCSECGRLPGFHRRGAEEQARRHLQSSHIMASMDGSLSTELLTALTLSIIPTTIVLVFVARLAGMVAGVSG